jgi:biopolymer transport protein ExbD
MLRRRKVPEINAGSMADIAFLLLTFFLMATTMNVERGISRQLPQVQSERGKPVEVKRRNLLQIVLDASDRLLLDGEPATGDELTIKIREFIANPHGDPKLPEKETERIEFFGDCEVSRGIILLATHRESSYEAYIAAQNLITQTFNDMRNELACSRFSRRFTELDRPRRDAVRRAVPMRISETSL